MPIAGGVSGGRCVAAVRVAQAVGTRGIGLADLAFWQAVVAEEQEVGVVRELLRQQMSHGLEVFGSLVEGREDEELGAGGKCLRLFDGGGARRACVLRVERHEQDFVDGRRG